MTQALEKLLDKNSQKRHTHHILLTVQKPDGTEIFHGAAGDAQPDSPYFIASITKMMTAAVIMQLVDENQVVLDAPIKRYLSPDSLIGIHTINGVDHSSEIRVHHLLHQTSGLADYFEGKPPNGKSLTDDFKAGKDRAYSVQDVLAMVHKLQPDFAPGAQDGRKSAYSDTNYQLLSAIIEKVTQKPLAAVFHNRIFERLGLTETYLYDVNNLRAGTQPLPFYFKDQRIELPLALSSERGAGGVVSTTRENLVFLRAFFQGQLFDGAHLKNHMQRWNPIFFPMQYGYGIMRFQLPRAMTLFRYSPELIGHSGSSASFSFYAPKEQLYMAGTFNQFDAPNRPFAFMLKVVDAAK